MIDAFDLRSRWVERFGEPRCPRAASSSRQDLCRSLDGASACCKARRRDRVRRHHPTARARTACAALFQMTRTHPWAPCLYSVRRCFGRSASKRNVACCLQWLGCEQVACSNGCDRARSMTGSWRSTRARPWGSTPPGRRRPICFALHRTHAGCSMPPRWRSAARRLSVGSTGSEGHLYSAGLGGLYLLVSGPDRTCGSARRERCVGSTPTVSTDSSSQLQMGRFCGGDWGNDCESTVSSSSSAAGTSAIVAASWSMSQSAGPTH
jgi:hypothetical protein